MDRGNLVDAQVTAWVQNGMPPTDPDAKACVEWICTTFDPTTWELHAQFYVRSAVEGLKRGTADLIASNGVKAVVVDYKKREQWIAGRLPAPDDNDQLHAYGLGFELPYQLCLLLFGDGKVEAMWSKTEYNSHNTGPILERIKAICAASGPDPKGTSGDHCGKCWPRIHCPHWALRGHKGLADPTRPDRENAGELMLETVAMEELAKRNREVLKHLVDTDGPFRVGDREFRRVIIPGKVSVDTAALEEAGLYERFSKIGRPFPQYRLSRPQE